MCLFCLPNASNRVCKNLALKSPLIWQCFILILVVALKLKQNLEAANGNGVEV